MQVEGRVIWSNKRVQKRREMRRKILGKRWNG
jgi:hypothetical protein